MSATKIHRSFLISSSFIHKIRHSLCFILAALNRKKYFRNCIYQLSSIFLPAVASLGCSCDKVRQPTYQIESRARPCWWGVYKQLGWWGEKWRKAWRHEETICFPTSSSCGSGRESWDKKNSILTKAGGKNFTLISERYTAVLVSIVLTSQPCKPESCLLVERMTFHLHSLLSKEVMLAV